MIRLPCPFSTAELIRLQYSTDGMPTGESDHGLRWVPFAVVDEFVAGGFTEWVLGTTVQICEGLQDVFAGEVRGDGWRHGRERMIVIEAEAVANSVVQMSILLPLEPLLNEFVPENFVLPDVPANSISPKASW